MSARDAGLLQTTETHTLIRFQHHLKHQCALLVCSTRRTTRNLVARIKVRIKNLLAHTKKAIRNSNLSCKNSILRCSRKSDIACKESILLWRTKAPLSGSCNSHHWTVFAEFNLLTTKALWFYKCKATIKTMQIWKNSLKQTILGRSCALWREKTLAPHKIRTERTCVTILY